MTFGSLFAGIGGFDLGFERAGLECRWQVETDDYATKILEKHWPHVHKERDIRECGKHNLKYVDVICGGFPCQDISYAGRGAGLDGERSGLFFEAIRVVQELRPRILVLENVAALLTRGLDRVLGTLAEVGFDAEWHCLSASAFGAYHIRDRIFILAYPNGHRRSPVTSASGVPFQRSRKTATSWCGHKPELKRDLSGKVWACPSPAILGMADGFSRGLDEDRLRGLGNAVVPQVAEFIGRQLLQH